VGYQEGGQLTEAVRRRPYTVVLFDEIEKAHPDVFNMMLQILEDGRLTDSKGRTVDFKNTLIIMTSNVGASVIEKGGRSMGFFLRPDDEDMEQDMSYSRIKSLVNEELKSYFRPEFLNRLDEIIVFRQLTKKEVKQIADIFLRDVFKRAEEKGIKIEVTEKFKDRCAARRQRRLGPADLVWRLPSSCQAASAQCQPCTRRLAECAAPGRAVQARGRGVQPHLRRATAAPRHHAPHRGLPGGAHPGRRHQGKRAGCFFSARAACAACAAPRRRNLAIWGSWPARGSRT
jgi:MoxR-like ATPase